jgi:hypothetical protein
MENLINCEKLIVEETNNPQLDNDQIESSNFSQDVLDGKDEIPFPEDSLPEILRSYCKLVADCYCVPIEFPAVAGLFACAVANGNANRLINGPYENLTIFWNLILADTGKQKTPPQKEMLKPLFERDKQSQKIYKEKQKVYQSLKKEQMNESVPPEKKQFLLSDVTLESSNWQHNYNRGQGVGIYSDEITRYLGSLGKYNKAADAEKSNRLERYSNVPIVVNRVGNGDGDSSFTIYDSPENLLGGHQPSRLNRIVSKDSILSGDFARYNFFLPIDYKKGGKVKEISQSAQKKYETLINRIFKHSPQRMYDDTYEREIHRYQLSSEAQAIYDKFKIECDRIHNESPIGHYLRGIEGKTLEKASRLALLIQVIDDAFFETPSPQISGLNMGRAIELAKYHFFCSVKVAKSVLNEEEVAPLSKRDLIRQLFRFNPKINKKQFSEVTGFDRSYVQKCLENKNHTPHRQ